MHSNSYTLWYAIVSTAIVAVILAVAASSLRPMQERNVAEAKRAAIMQSVMEVDPSTLERDYNSFISERVFDAQGQELPSVSALDLDLKKEMRLAPQERNYPLYLFTRDGEVKYIIPLQGKGLWGPITAFVALESDGNTIFGVVFEHEKETPGLGAEISTSGFQERFRGKTFFGDDGSFQSVRILKGSGHDVSDEAHQVDGLTGATMTLNGVNAMLSDGISRYESILSGIKSQPR